MKVYLAGPINGRTDADCKGWREVATGFLGAENVIDPMRNDYRGREFEPGIATVIVERDKADIQMCTAMLVYFDAPSVGTAMEILCGWQIGRPVYVVNASGRPPSPWLVYHSHLITSNLNDALYAIEDRHARIAGSP